MSMSKNGHGNVLLFEITIVLFFFALSATVMLGMFLTAHNLSVNSREMNTTLFAAENYVEMLCGSDNPENYLTAVGFEFDGTRYYNDKDQSLKMSVQLSADTASEGLVYSAIVSVEGDNEVVTALPATWYVPVAAKEEA